MTKKGLRLAGRNALVLLFLASFLMSCSQAAPPIEEAPPSYVLSISGIYNTGLTITWPVLEDQNPTDYSIYLIPSNNEAPLIKNINAKEVIENGDGTLSYVVDGLSEQTEYTVEIVPKAAGRRLLTIRTKDKEAVSTNNIILPQAPSDLAAKTEILNETLTVTLSWSAADPGSLSNNQKAQIDHYLILVNSGNSTETLVSPDDTTSMVITTWAPLTSYTLSIKAVNNEDRESPPSDPITEVTPSIASNLGVVDSHVSSDITSSSFTLSWDPVLPQRTPKGLVSLTSYKVYLLTLPNPPGNGISDIVKEENIQDDDNDRDTTIHITNLPSESTHYLVIKAVAGNGNNPQETVSNIITVVTEDD